MPSPILFFIFIIVIDLILKSNRDRKKIQESKRKTPMESNIPRPMQDLRRILDEELEREKQRQRGSQAKPKIQQRANKELKPRVQYIEEDKSKEKSGRDILPKMEYGETKAPDLSKAKNNVNEKDKFKKNLLTGIVFSQILSEPKSIQNQRRSL